MLDRRLLVVTGKGGVGRSAISAALAIVAARSGRRVLLIGLTEGVGIAQHLGAQQLDYQPRELRPGVHALAVDLGPALDEYLRVRLHVPRVTWFGPLQRAFQVLATTTPGIREIIAIGKPLYEVADARWDIVIIDGPPTGQIVSYLHAPRTIGSLVPAGRVRDQASWMEGLIADPIRSGLVMVAIPEELPVRETRDSLGEIRRQRLIEVVAVMANRVLDPLRLAERRLEELPDGPHRAAAHLHASLYASQQEWLAELRPDRKLPYQFGLLTPPEVAARLADLLEEA